MGFSFYTTYTKLTNKILVRFVFLSFSHSLVFECFSSAFFSCATIAGDGGQWVSMRLFHTTDFAKSTERNKQLFLLLLLLLFFIFYFLIRVFVCIRILQFSNVPSGFVVVL